MINKIFSEATKQGIYLYLKDGRLAYKATAGDLSEEFKKTIVENRAAIIEFLEFQNKSAEFDANQITVFDRNSGSLSLSFAQQRLWLLDQIDGGSYYNIPSVLRLTGEPDLQALTQAFNSIVERHESLRTCFAVDENGQPVQVIQAITSLIIPVIDLSDLPESERQLQLNKCMAEEFGRAFDLSHDLMLRAQLIKLTNSEHIVLVSMHHIASDGWSMSILINEFSALYSAYVQQQPNPLAPLKIQYADYAHWQRDWLQGDVLEQQLSYWIKQLSGLPAVHSLPLDHTRPSVQSFKGKIYNSCIDVTTHQHLNQLCQSESASLFMGLHAAFSVLLARYSNETDIVIGSPIANREQAEIAGLIGFFVNTLVLRSDLSANPDFISLVQQSKRMLLDAYAHQQVPFEQIVERLQPERSLSHSALFQIMLVLQNNEQGILELPGLTLSAVDQGNIRAAKFDLTLTLVESEQGLDLEWEYNTDLFEESTIARMANHFGLLLTSLLAQPNENVFKVGMLDEQERHQLLIDWNNTPTDYPNDKCIHELFETQVENNPDAVAVSFENQQLTYGELNQKANQLAHYLINEKHVKPDTLVGICVERSLEMVVGILAILKAGGAYVPLDPEYPEARLKYMLDDANLSTVLTQKHLRETTPVSDEQAVCLDAENIQQQLQTYPTSNPDSHALGLTSNHLAYIIYTSGSTGNPKGVMVEHYNVTRLFDSAEEHFEFNEQDVWTLFHSYAFDFSVWEIWGALVKGGRLVVVPYWVSRSPGDFYQLLKDEQVTVLNQTPSAFNSLMQEDRSQASHPALALRYVVFGGEALNLASLLPWFERHGDDQPQLINMYGITETTVHVTYRRITQCLAQESAGSLIGNPLADLNLVILNEHQQLAPIGVAGEMYVGGAGVTRGYLNQQGLTEQRFVSLPGLQEGRFYRTGDLARYLADGELEYLGRIDHQVKVRGFRIELGEIENSLSSHSDVKEAVVLAKGNSHSDKYLVAYVATDAVALGQVDEAQVQDAQTRLADRQAFIDNVRHHLGQSLPDYMVPNVFVLLESFPLTANGKIDRKALPEPDVSLQQVAYVAPRNETEVILCNIWQDVLGVEKVGIHDNFFQLGGHSLSATRLIALTNSRFNTSVPLRALFNSPVLSELADVLSTLDKGAKYPPLVSISREHALPASYAQQRLWVLDKISGGSTHYNIPFALKLTGQLHIDALEYAFSNILERHESLRTCFVVGEDGQPTQVIQPAVALTVSFTDLSTLAAEEQQAQLDQRAAEEAGRAFDLRQDFMLRAQLIKLSTEEHIVLVTMHHIASDGWSMSILINEFRTFYSAHIQGEANPLPILAFQYADYAHWQRNWLQGEVLDEQLSYWEGQLSGLPIVHGVPLDNSRPSQQSFAGAVHRSMLDRNTLASLNRICQQQDATLFMGLHAAFCVLLARYSNETDIVIGSPIANREQAEIAGLIGFFVNTLVLRSDLSANPDFISLVQQSKRMLLDAYAHQQVPFEQIVERLQPERSLSHSALFQIMLVLQNNEQGILELPGLTLSAVDQGNIRAAKFDLTLTLVESEQGLDLEWEYNTDLFEESTIARMANHFGLLLTSLLAQPNENVFKVGMLNEQERHQLLIDWNNTPTDYPNDKCIHELFETQVENNPDAVAASFENQQLTYGELNQKANQLAHYLINEKHVKPDTLVGICVERSLEMVVGILAILKAGGAYVPLDPEYPEARLKYMLDDANLSTVLTQKHLRETTPVSDEQAVCLDAENIQQQLQTYPTSNPDSHALGLTSNHLAYIIYTSGSTGNPKGVMVEHYNVTRLFDSAEEHFEFNEQDVWTLFHSYAFDFSVWEIWGALVKGGRLVVVPYWVSRSPGDFYQLLKDEQVTVLNQTPSAFNSLMQEDRSQASHPALALRYVVFGGEALNLASLLPWFERHGDDQPQLINMYGITETTVHVTYRRITQCLAQESAGSLIGNPLADLNLVILNEHQQLAPIGVAGEMYVGGAGVTRGYLNQQGLTEQRFVCLPGLQEGRFYRTGDLARYLADGELEYLGRIDHQVKVRGFRIELGEIENSLSSHSDVKEAVVLAKGNSHSDKYLVAYVATDAVALGQVDEAQVQDAQTRLADRQAFIDNVRHHLGQSLPDYMVPNVFVLLESFPLTANGKIDRKALPEPDVSLQQVAYVAPRNETEVILCNIWQDVLGVEKVGIHDNFFQLGGHSLSVLQLVSAMNEALTANITVKDIFTAQTIERLMTVSDFSQASIIYQQLQEGLQYIAELQQALREDPQAQRRLPADIEDFYPLSPIQQSMVFFAQSQPELPLYHDQFPYVLSVANFNLDAFKQAVTELGSAHSILRTSFDVMNFAMPFQFVHSRLPITFELEDLSSLSPAVQQARVEAYRQQDLQQKFSFEISDPLWRMGLFDLGANEICVILSCQHAILDGWSVNALLDEMVRRYTAISQQAKILPVLASPSYKDYVAINIARSMANDAHSFWQGYLQGYSRMKLPFNYGGRPVSDESNMRVLRMDVSDDLLQQLHERSRLDGFSIKELCLASYVYMLSLLTGDTEVLTGVVSHDRPELPDADKILGCFLNTVPLRMSVNESMDKHTLLQGIKESLLQLKIHELFLVDIARAVGEHNPNGNPLFDTIFNFTDFPVMAAMPTTEGDVLSLSGSREQITVGTAEMTNTLLDIEVHRRGQQTMTVQVKYVPKYFHPHEIDVIMDVYMKALTLLASNQTSLSQADIISSVNSNVIHADFNRTDRAYRSEATLHQLFEEQVVRSPDAVALRQHGQHMSYIALNCRANQIARLLQKKGVKSGDTVGIVMERSMDLIAGIFGILKAGAVYVPMEPAYPSVRKQAIADSAGLTAILVDAYAQEENDLYIQINDEVLSGLCDENLALEKDARDLAYIIYTSGSTGKPKGVRIAHHAAVNLVAWVNREFSVNEADIMLCITSVTFDLSVYDIFGLLSAGGSIVIAEQSQIHNPDALVELIRTEKVTFWDSVPTTLNHLVSELNEHPLQETLDSLRLVFMSGDWIPVQLPAGIRRHFPNARVISLGGATEGTVWSNFYPVPEYLEHRHSIPYGKPIDNNRFYILDTHQRPVIQGVVGELYIAGVGVAEGYQGDEERTANAFFKDCLVQTDINGQTARMYKTGDLGRLLPCGNMELHGRVDHQVKLRGFRIELGEIESLLNQHPLIKEAVVNMVNTPAAEGRAANQYLVGYVVAKAGSDLYTEGLAHYLAEYLPEYMVPKLFVTLDKLPLTQNGKVDRKALPQPDLSEQIAHRYVAPTTEIEKQLCEICQDVLSVERVGITDNFFDLGGHSLLMMKIISKISHTFNVVLPLQKLFTLQTVELLAAEITAQQRLIKMQLVEDSDLSTDEIELIL